MQWRQIARPLYDYIAAASRQEADALDILQITTEEALLHYEALRNPDAFRAWIFRIAYRCQLRYYRDKHVDVLSLEGMRGEWAEASNPPDLLILGREEEQVRNYIEKLPDPWDRALYLHLYYRAALPELCELFQMPYARVQRRLHRIRRDLRRVLEEGGYRHEGTVISKEDE